MDALLHRPFPCPHADYEGEVQARIDAGYRGTRKVRKELGALAAEAQQMRKSGKQLESERASRRPESRSKGVDR